MTFKPMSCQHKCIETVADPFRTSGALSHGSCLRLFPSRKIYSTPISFRHFIEHILCFLYKPIISLLQIPHSSSKPVYNFLHIKKQLITITETFCFSYIEKKFKKHSLWKLEPEDAMQVCYSPQLGSASKNPSSFRHSGAYTSPGTPDYGDNSVGSFQKGWYSERVPLPSNSSRRHISAAALMPFNSGRTLPSKWDDAERWITSPVSGFGVCKTTAPPPRRPKAKSGPLGGTTTPGVLEGGSNKNFFAGSPLTTGVLVPNGLPFHHAGVINSAHTEYGVVQSANIPGWSELLVESSYTDSQDENGVSRVVSRRDMATQMSPVSSPEASPTYIPSPVEGGSRHSARLEVRDVQVDKGVTMTKRLKRHGIKKKNNRSVETNDLSLTWNTTEGAMKLSKLQKEEARITAWENLQNAKAEASIRKLEMKLERKKSASLDKILNKHRGAQIKAQEMRRRMSETADPRSSWKFRRFFKNSIGGCFHCHHS